MDDPSRRLKKVLTFFLPHAWKRWGVHADLTARDQLQPGLVLREEKADITHTHTHAHAHTRITLMLLYYYGMSHSLQACVCGGGGEQWFCKVVWQVWVHRSITDIKMKPTDYVDFKPHTAQASKLNPMEASGLSADMMDTRSADLYCKIIITILQSPL